MVLFIIGVYFITSFAYWNVLTVHINYAIVLCCRYFFYYFAEMHFDSDCAYTIFTGESHRPEANLGPQPCHCMFRCLMYDINNGVAVCPDQNLFNFHDL